MKKILIWALILSMIIMSAFMLSCNNTIDNKGDNTNNNTTPPSPTETETLDSCQNGHTIVVDEAVAPTCLEKGTSEGSHCSVCGEIITAQQEIEALGHSGGDWIIEINADCNTAGLKTQKCTVCGEIAANEIVDPLCSSGKQITLDLKDYNIIYADSENTYFLSEINRFASILKTSTEFSSNSTAESKSTVSSKEILIGLTSRAESRIAYESIHGTGYTINMIGDKIVIVGTDDTMTLAAINYFINTYVFDDSRSVILAEKYSLCNTGYITFANEKGSSFAFVLDHDLDRNTLHAYVNDSSDKRDFPCVLMDRLVKLIAEATKSEISSYNITTDKESTMLDGYEVLFGIVDREESNAYRLTLDAHEYGFKITDKKLIITAQNDLALEDAVEAFNEFYKYIVTYANGNLPVGYEYKGSVTDQNWITEFPRPDGENVNISFSQHNNDDSLQILYEGAGVNAETFLAYCAKLEAAGYVIVTKNDDPGSTGSYFRTYKNVETGHVLYVAYNAYKYKDIYKDTDRKNDHVLSATVTNKTVYYPMRDYNACIRIVSAPIDKAYLPTDDLLVDDYDRATQKVTESSITAVRYYGNSVGMGYIIQLEDGSFFIVDGGNNSNSDEVVLYNILVELFKKSHNGQSPSVDNPLHIKAWLITHSHSDHFNTASQFLLRYAKLMKTVTMDYLIGNFPETYSMYTVASGALTMGNGATIPKLQSYVPGGFEYIKVHTGQVLYLANLKLEVIMTTEDHAPFRIDNTNDTNTVTKLTIRSDNKDTTWMMLGDSCIYQSRWMCAMWGGNTYNTTTGLYDNSYLKADMVQLAHHGNIGCEIAIYKTIQAEVLWFPHTSAAFNSYVYGSSQHWRSLVDKYVAKTLPTLKYIFVSGWYNDSNTFKDYHDSITLEFTADGPNYNDIWGVNYRKTNSSVVSKIEFNSGTGKVVDSPVIKKK